MTIPAALQSATEPEVLACLAELIRSRKITACQARRTWTAYQVARSEAGDAQPYLIEEWRRGYRQQTKEDTP